MKLFYTCTLILGIMMAFVMQFVTIALPPDAFVASTLSQAPDRWSVKIDDTLRGRLSYRDVKTELITALQKRASFRNEIYKQSLWGGLALIALSVIGLIRERQIRKLKKIEQTHAERTSETAPSAASEASDA